MQIELIVTDAGQYLEKIGQEIDWEKEGLKNGVSVEEGEALQKILTCEVSYYALRRSYGICGSLADDMQSIRRNFINEYEKKYNKKYLYPNQDCDF